MIQILYNDINSSQSSNLTILLLFERKNLLSNILFDIFFKLRDDYDCSIVIVTHNPENAKKCDRKLQIVDGKIKV